MKKKVKASALLSSILVLTTCLIYVSLYQQVYCQNLENSRLIIKYLEDN